MSINMLPMASVLNQVPKPADGSRHDSCVLMAVILIDTWLVSERLATSAECDAATESELPDGESTRQQYVACLRRACKRFIDSTEHFEAL